MRTRFFYLFFLMIMYQSVLNLVEMPYHWGTMINGQWQKMGTIVITHQGVLLDQEKLANPRFHPTSRSLIFGGSYRSYTRAGRLTFDRTQLYFHGTMEQKDGNMAQIIGFADYSWTFSSMIKPVSDPNAPGKKGPILKITIDRTAFDGILDTNPVQVSLNENGTAVDVTNRVTSHNLNKVNHTFEMTMGQGGPFPPTTNLFDVTMATDFSQFDGTYDFNSQTSKKFLWSGLADQASMTTLKVAIQQAKYKLKEALVPKMEYAELATNSPVCDASLTISDTSEAAILPGLDAEDIAFLAKMKANGMNIAALDNIRAISIGTDKDGKSKVIDPAQELTAKMMNMASVKTLTEPWVTDFGIKAEPILPKAETVRQNNLEFFGKNAELQMANVLKYKQDNFTGVNATAIKKISKKKLKEAWSFKSMTPKRASGYIKASTELYGVAYEQINEEFALYTASEKEQWGRAYFHWLTDPSQIGTWQKQMSVLDADQITIWIYEWHAKLSILAPMKPYAAAMEAYALAAFINAKAQLANWTEGGIPFLTEAIAGGGQSTVQMKTASGEDVSSKQAPFIKKQLAALQEKVGEEAVAKAISKAALSWQKANPGISYYGYLYTSSTAIDDIAQQLEGVERAAFTAWATSFPAGSDPSDSPSAGKILSYCVFAAINCVLLAGLAPKSTAGDQGIRALNSGIHLPPDIAWVLKGVKIGQVVINGGGNIFSILFTREISSLWTQYIGAEGEEAPELSEALSALSSAIEDGEEIASWALSFGAKAISSVVKVLGPILSIVGLGLSSFNLAQDIINNRPIDGIADAIGVLAGVIGVGVAIGVAAGLLSSASAGPIGLAIAVVGLIIFVFKLIWDHFFPTPTPIEKFVAGPLTSLGLVNTS